MKKVAVIIDGGFARIQFNKAASVKGYPKAEQMVKLGELVLTEDEELFRIYYYDCPPYDNELISPVTKTKFKNEGFIRAGKEFLSNITRQPHVAYRTGVLKSGGWELKQKSLVDKVNTESYKLIDKE
ncbi:MAG: hypothetical protein ABSD71_13360 [Bacteroidales bacterium]